MKINDWESYQKQLYEKAYEEAHIAFLAEKATLIKELEVLAEALAGYADGGKYTIPEYWSEKVCRAIKFIEHVKG